MSVATNETPEDPVEQRVSGAQTQIIVRLLVGVLFEAWRLVQGRLLGSELGKEFVPQLDDAASQALDRLKKAFGGSNINVAVRNDFSFHHPKPDDMEAAFQATENRGNMEDQDWGIYSTTTFLNTFFFISDYVFAHGIALALKDEDVNEARKKTADVARANCE